jgi:transcription elongation factor GreB
MSRAFVDEDNSRAAETEAPEIKIPIPPGSRNYLTPEGAERLTAELHELTDRQRPRIMADVARAATSGAGNDELAALRRELGRTDRRIEYLLRMSRMAEIVTPPESGYDRVRFGARVRVREESGAELEYRIVGVDEADLEHGLIGWTSPVARALMGRKAGDTASVRLPAGEKRLLVLELR